MRRYLCAGSFKHADNTAVIDWGWKRTGQWTWATKEGDEVRYLSRKQQLDGVRDCILYLGFDWFENSELGPAHEFRARCHARNIELVDDYNIWISKSSTIRTGE